MSASDATEFTPQIIHATAIQAARSAGEAQLRCRQTGNLTIDRTFAHDIKLKADRLSEAAAFGVIRALMPEATIHSEEAGTIDGSGDYIWIVDPLDGTMNYFHGQHHFCSCVACYRKIASAPALDAHKSQGISKHGEPVAGAVYAAAYDELFAGMPGGGSSCNDRRLRVSAVQDLAEAVITTSFGSKPEIMERMEGVIHRLLRCTRKLRIQGSCGLDICAVAAGRLSALYQSDVRCWDFAAASIILEEAGGILDATEFAPGRWNVLACAPGIYPQLREVIGTP